MKVPVGKLPKMTLPQLIAFVRAGFKLPRPAIAPFHAQDIEQLEFRCATQWPKYYRRRDMFYKMVDDKRLQVVCVKAGFTAVADRSRAGQHFLFRYWRQDQLEAKNFREITESLYHEYFCMAADHNSFLHRTNTTRKL